VPAFVDRWERLPLWASQTALPAAARNRQREVRLAQRAVGLANALRGFGQGVQPPLWDALPRLPMPVLALAGSLDAKYAAGAAEVARAVPRGRAVVIEGCGHAPHLERPEAFLAAVVPFLADGA
jgi:pimeloyl-ACP methyl ester carboxylesterase